MPDTSFAVVDGFDPDSKPNANVAYLTFAANESSYLVGAAAALTSKRTPVRRSSSGCTATGSDRGCASSTAP